jgi:PHD/YefM family antitoxin component YafN of YafNO toxin-antitoxin module
MAKTLTIDVKDIRSVTDFQRNAKTHITRLKKTKAPMVLTVNGSASVIVQDANTYQRLLDRVEEMEERERFIAAVNEGLRDIEEGRVYPAREALKALGRELGVSR